MPKKSRILTALKKAKAKIEKISLNQLSKDEPPDTKNGVVKNNKKYNFLLTWKEIKYIPKFLSPREKVIIKIAALVIVFSLILLLYFFLHDNLVAKPAKGGIYTENTVGTPQYINPIYATVNDVDRDLVRLIFAGLIKFDAQHKIKADLAKEWFISDDKKTYTFKLKPNIFWPDGKQFTSEDIVYTVKLIQDTDYNSPLNLSWAGIEVKALDNLTVQFKLPKAYASFLTDKATLGILPAHIWSEIPPERARLTELNLKPIGLGPYQFESFVKDKRGYIKSYTLKSNNHYHNKIPYITQITFKFQPNFETAVASLRNHNADGLSFLPINLKDLLKQRKDLNYYNLTLPQYTAIFFNKDKNKLLEDKKIRQALNLLVNRKKIIDQALEGEATPIDSPLLPDMPGYSDFKYANAQRFLEAQRILKNDGWDYINKNDKTTASSTPGTKQIKQYLEKDGQPLEITLTTADQPQATMIAKMIQNDWEKAGVKTNLKIVKTTQIQKEIIEPRDFEALLFGEILDAQTDLYPFWHSNQNKENSLNLSNFKNKELDKILTNLQTKHEKKLYLQLKKIFAKEIPAIFLYNPKYTYVIANKVKGVNVKRIVTPEDRLNGIANWYIKTKKRLK